MKPSTTAVVAAVACCAVAFAGLVCELTPDRGPLTAFSAEARERERLEVISATVYRRLLVRDELGRELLSERMSLRDAIARSRALYPEGFNAPVPGDSEDERLGLVLISWAANSCPDAERVAVVHRLREELRGLLDREPFWWESAFWPLTEAGLRPR